MEFKEYELRDICKFQEGYVNPKQTKAEYFDGEVKWLRANDLQNSYVYNTSKTLTKEGFKSAGKSAKLFKPNTIAISKSGTIGRLGILKDYMCGNRAVINIESNEKLVDIKYIYYFLLQNRAYIESLAQGSVQKNLYIFILEKVKIRLPDKEKQRKILNILNNIDNKIELNNQINNNLQELILTLYKKFIEDNSEAEEVTLEDCVKKIGTGADAIQRAPIVDYDTGIRCIRVGDMTNNRKCYEWGFAKMTDKDFNNYKLDIGDIVITRTAVNGLSYLIEDSMNIVCNNGLIRLKVNEKYNPLYIYLTMKTKDFYNYIHRIDSETSVRPNMKVDYLTSYKIKKISLEKQNQFCDMIKSMRQRQKEIEYENNNLTQLRDTLLPKLMNGEIDLDNIEI